MQMFSQTKKVSTSYVKRSISKVTLQLWFYRKQINIGNNLVFA